jgi:hypothetical protein
MVRLLGLKSAVLFILHRCGFSWAAIYSRIPSGFLIGHRWGFSWAAIYSRIPSGFLIGHRWGFSWAAIYKGVPCVCQNTLFVILTAYKGRPVL